MAEGISSTNIPPGTVVGEVLGHEIIGGTRSTRRFPTSALIGAIGGVIGGAGGAVIFSSKAIADGKLNYAADQMAWIVTDPDPAKNGIYQKIGPSSGGSWARRADLPYEIVTFEVTGGTPSEIEASAFPQLPSQPLNKLFLFTPSAANPGAVTIQIPGFENGGPKAITNALGAPLAANSWLPGSQVIMTWFGDHFQLLLPAVVDGDAVLAQVIEARDDTIEAKEAIEAILGDVSPPSVTSRTAMKALDTGVVKYIYLSEGLRSGPWVFKLGNYTARIAADTREGMFIKANAISAGVGAWVREYTGPLDLSFFGGLVADDSTDNTTEILATLATLGAYSGEIAISEKIRFDTSVVVQALPDKVSLRFWNVMQSGSGYRQQIVGIADHPPDANTDTAFSVLSGHYPDIMINNMRTAGTTSADIGLSGFSYGRGFFKNGTKGPRVQCQYNFVKSPVRQSEYGGKGVGCFIIRQRSPERAGNYEGWFSGIEIQSGDYILAANGNFYQASSTGTSTVSPTHTSGSATVGGVTWSFDSAWINFKTSFYVDEMGRVGNEPCDSGLTQYWRQNPEDPDSFIARWQAEGVSKTTELRLGAKNSGGTTQNTSIVAGTSGDLTLYTNGTRGVRVEAGATLIPTQDNWSGLGKSGARWFDVWSVNGTIQTSNAREKTPVEMLSEAELAAAKALAREIGLWRWLRDVAAHGDDAVKHIGVTVQRIVEVMEAHGLDPWAYGIVHYHSYDAVPAEYDGRGNIVAEARPAGDSYSLSPTDFFMFIAAGFEARLAALETT